MSFPAETWKDRHFTVVILFKEKEYEEEREERERGEGEGDREKGKRESGIRKREGKERGRSFAGKWNLFYKTV